MQKQQQKSATPQQLNFLNVALVPCEKIQTDRQTDGKTQLLETQMG